MYVTDHLIGEKNGKRSGMMLNIVLLNAKKQKNIIYDGIIYKFSYISNNNIFFCCFVVFYSIHSSRIWGDQCVEEKAKKAR